jgi:hypothetical protein
MKINKLVKLSAYALCVSLWLYTGCSGGDEPEPFDCGTSDLELSLTNDTDPSSCLVSDGSIAVAAMGGKTPYRYKLNSGGFGSSPTFSNLGGGTYTVTVRDDNNCEKQIKGISLAAPSGPVAGASTVVAQTSCLAPNGSITANVTGGTTPYMYKIGSGTFGTSETFSNLKSGAYVITVQDNAGCLITLNESVSSTTGITYNGDILTIFQAKCLLPTCHLNNENGMGNWGIYSQAFSKRAEIKSRTQSGDMPRTGSLSDDQKALIACWVDGGAPQN